MPSVSKGKESRKHPFNYRTIAAFVSGIYATLLMMTWVQGLFSRAATEQVS